MKKDFRLSISQLKKLNKSVAQWAGLYVLEIEERFDNVNTIAGNMFHLWIETWDDKKPMQFLNKLIVENMDRVKVLWWYDNLKEHYSYYNDIVPGTHEERIEYEYLGFKFLAFIDFVSEDRTVMKDWKAVSKFCDPDKTYPNHWSDLTTYEEYELQAWQYMVWTGIKRLEFVEFLKHNDTYKRKYKNFAAWDRKFRPEDSHQIIAFEWSESWNKKMAEYWDPKILEAKEVWDKFKPSVEHIE